MHTLLSTEKEVYLNEYKNMKVLKKSIEKYMISYNTKRLHSAIGYKTPNEVYYQLSIIQTQKEKKVTKGIVRGWNKKT